MAQVELTLWVEEADKAALDQVAAKVAPAENEPATLTAKELMEREVARAAAAARAQIEADHLARLGAFYATADPATRTSLDLVATGLAPMPVVEVPTAPVEVPTDGAPADGGAISA